MNGFRLALPILATLSLLSGGLHAAAQPDWLLGAWTLDNEATVAAQEKTGKGFSNPLSNARTSISVGGMQVPVGGSSSSSGGGGKDPEVLRCAELRVSMQGEDVHFEYVGVGAETMQPGTVHGRRTKWSRSKLTSRYETMSRKVSYTYALQKDDSLLVTVRLKPSQGQAVVHKRVFQRATS